MMACQSNDNNLFNIGKLKNIGFDIANKNNTFDNYLLTDIDMIPDFNLLKLFDEKIKGPLSCAINGTRYTHPDNFFFGGQIYVDKNMFEKVNGYPNNFYGWGREDVAILYRFIYNKYTIYYPNEKIGVIDIEENEKGTKINIKEKMNLLKNKKEHKAFEKSTEDINSWKKNGLNSLQYKIIEKIEIYPDSTEFIVDLMKKDDEKKYPFLFPKGEENNKYIIIKNQVKNKLKEIKNKNYKFEII